MVDLSPSAPPAETASQKEARLRAEAQANARNTKALQGDLRAQTREFLRRFGLNGALGEAGSPLANIGFGQTLGTSGSSSGGSGGGRGGGGLGGSGAGGGNTGIGSGYVNNVAQ